MSISVGHIMNFMEFENSKILKLCLINISNIFMNLLSNKLSIFLLIYVPYERMLETLMVKYFHITLRSFSKLEKIF